MFSTTSLRLAGAALLLAAGIPAIAAETSADRSNSQAASDSAAAPAAKPGKAAKRADGRICKTIATSGTRLAKKSQKVCLTAKQWRDAEY